MRWRYHELRVAFLAKDGTKSRSSDSVPALTFWRDFSIKISQDGLRRRCGRYHHQRWRSVSSDTFGITVTTSSFVSGLPACNRRCVHACQRVILLESAGNDDGVFKVVTGPHMKATSKSLPEQLVRHRNRHSLNKTSSFFNFCRGVYDVRWLNNSCLVRPYAFQGLVGDDAVLVLNCVTDSFNNFSVIFGS